jgi:toxin CptA
MLGILGAVSAINSEMPRALAWPSALAACLQGLFLARRELRSPVREWLWPVAGPPTVDGVAVEAVVIRWRGPLAFLRWRAAGGRIHRLAWWPDVLDCRARRELRLAADRYSASRSAPRMAG